MIKVNNNALFTIKNLNVGSNDFDQQMVCGAREINKLLAQIILTSPRTTPTVTSPQISFTSDHSGRIISSHFFLKSLGFITLNNHLVAPNWLAHSPRSNHQWRRHKQNMLTIRMNRRQKAPSAPLPSRANRNSPALAGQAAEAPNWESFPVTPSAPLQSQMKIAPPAYQEGWDKVNMAREAYREEAPPPSYQREWSPGEVENQAVVDLTPPPPYSN